MPVQYNKIVVQADGTVRWGEYELARADYLGSTFLVDQIDTVLTKEDQTLTVYFLSYHSDPEYVLEYGIMEVIQVRIDGKWYDLPHLLPDRVEPLVMPVLSGDSDTREYLINPAAYAEHTVDLSVFGELPPGEYRLVERFLNVQNYVEEYRFAYFWVIESDEQPPPESETTGSPRASDFEFDVTSPVWARRMVTDADMSFILSVRNLSGKIYDMNGRLELEKWQDDRWVTNTYQYVSGGLHFGWSNNGYQLNLNKPLEAGEYRIRLRAKIFGNQSETIRPEYRFSVIPHENAPEPEWDATRLMLSRFDAREQSNDITMVLSDSVVMNENTTLRVSITANKYYHYEYSFDLEVLIDEKWYFLGKLFSVIGAENDEEYNTSIDPNTIRYQTIDPTRYTGILPVGKYRLIREFMQYEDDGDTSHNRLRYLTREFATSEFDVADATD